MNQEDKEEAARAIDGLVSAWREKAALALESAVDEQGVAESHVYSLCANELESAMELCKKP